MAIVDEEPQEKVKLYNSFPTKTLALGFVEGEEIVDNNEKNKNKNQRKMTFILANFTFLTFVLFLLSEYQHETIAYI